METGNIDLYIAFKNVNGEWTEGINMGSVINTYGFEFTPNISPDEKYLFFTRRYESKKVSTSDILGKLGYRTEDKKYNEKQRRMRSKAIVKAITLMRLT